MSQSQLNENCYKNILNHFTANRVNLIQSEKKYNKLTLKHIGIVYDISVVNLHKHILSNAHQQGEWEVSRQSQHHDYHWVDTPGSEYQKYSQYNFCFISIENTNLYNYHGLQ